MTPESGGRIAGMMPCRVYSSFLSISPVSGSYSFPHCGQKTSSPSVTVKILPFAGHWGFSQIKRLGSILAMMVPFFSG